MKRLALYLFLCFCMAQSAAAQMRPHRDFWHIEKIMSEKYPTITDSDPLANVSKDYTRAPQVIKRSDWVGGAWMGNSQRKYSYVNGVLAEELLLDFQGLDTFERTTYNYYFDNKVKSVFLEIKEQGKGWTPVRHTTITRYGSSIKTTAELTLEYNTNSLEWIPVRKITTTDDENGNRCYLAVETYDTQTKTLKLRNAYRLDITYFSNSAKPLLIFGNEYDASNNSWILKSKFENEFSNDGKLLSSYNGYYQGGSFIPEELRLFSYDSIQVAPISIVFFYFDQATMTYRPNRKEYNLVYANYNNTFIYYANELIKSTTAYPNSIGDFVDIDRFAKTSIDSNGSYTLSYEYFDEINTQWDSSSIEIKKFDTKGNLIQDSYQSLQFDREIFHDFRYKYTYNFSGDMVESILTYFDINNLQYSLAEKIEYSNYTNVLSGIGSNTNTLEAIVYPNPSADGNVYVKLTALTNGEVHCKVYTTNGQLVQANTYEAIVGINTLSIPTLQAGFYIIKLESAEGVAQYKLNVQ